MKLQMSRIQIVGLKSNLIPTVRALHNMNCIQVQNVSEIDDISARPLNLDREMVKQREQFTYLVTKIDGLLATLNDLISESDQANQYHLSQQSSVDDCVSEAQVGVDILSSEIQKLISKREKLESEQLSLPRYEATLRKLLPIVPPSAHAPENTFVGVLVNRSHSWVLNAIVEDVLIFTGGRAETITEDIDFKTRAMLIVTPREYSAKVSALLGREDITRLRLPEDIADQPPDTAVLALNQRMAKIPAELAEIKIQLTQLASDWLPRLNLWRHCLRIRLEEIDILANFGETDQTFVVAGWIPQKEIENVPEILAEQVGDGVFVQPIPLSKGDRKTAPVALVNPVPARPFQSLVTLFSLPKYEGIDPTLLMAIFLPMFFGMILGDIGYGVSLLILCLIGLRRFSKPGTQRDIVKVLTLGSIWSIVFGILYGELFGTLGEEFGMHPILFDRASAEEVTSLLLLSIAVGVVHITLGLILGIFEAIRENSRHELLERGGMLIGLIGLFLIASVMANRLPDTFMNPGVAVLLIGIVVLSSSLGWLGILLGPIEFIGLIGNILSYLRIAAVGLASVYLARLANEVVGMMGSIIVGIIIGVLIHALNLVLGAFSPTIHSLRLHYVEFFRKFYFGGGKPFQPFKIA